MLYASTGVRIAENPTRIPVRWRDDIEAGIRQALNGDGWFVTHSEPADSTDYFIQIEFRGRDLGVLHLGQDIYFTEGPGASSEKVRAAVRDAIARFVKDRI